MWGLEILSVLFKVIVIRGISIRNEVFLVLKFSFLFVYFILRYRKIESVINFICMS